MVLSPRPDNIFFLLFHPFPLSYTLLFPIETEKGEHREIFVSIG